MSKPTGTNVCGAFVIFLGAMLTISALVAMGCGKSQEVHYKVSDSMDAHDWLEDLSDRVRILERKANAIPVAEQMELEKKPTNFQVVFTFTIAVRDLSQQKNTTIVVTQQKKERVH